MKIDSFIFYYKISVLFKSWFLTLLRIGNTFSYSSKSNALHFKAPFANPFKLKFHRTGKKVADVSHILTMETIEYRSSNLTDARKISTKKSKLK